MPVRSRATRQPHRRPQSNIPRKQAPAGSENSPRLGRIGLYRIGAIGALWLAFWLRLYRLGAESLWYDEIVSVDLASTQPAALIAQTARDIHPPGYYLLLHLWQAISLPIMELGQSFEFLYAYPSLFFGMLVCALVFSLARRFFSPTVAGVALMIAAVHPFQVEYSQEVRMYTLGAALCLLYLWAFVRLWMDSPGARLTPRRATIRVVETGLLVAAGLYTFYYFVFQILAMAIALGVVMGHTRRAQFKQRLLTWAGGHLLGLLLWLPWLPIFFRQAIDPPVPPWRAPWQGLNDLLDAVHSLVHAYFSGHTFETNLWIGSATALILGGLWLWARRQSPRSAASQAELAPLLSRQNLHVVVPAMAAFAPPLIIIVLSALATPLFHPRYLYVYHGPFLILLAALWVWLTRRKRLPTVAAGALLAALWSAGLYTQWFDPTQAKDDHRAAVAYIAERWQPGDAILVNAGWVYRALNVYWPTRHTDPASSLPPIPGQKQRLNSEASPHVGNERAQSVDPVIPGANLHAPIYYTGSIFDAETDSLPNLGWQEPQADFYATTADATRAALDTLAQHHNGLWHYRIYDTVNDPQAVIRTWLDDQGHRLVDLPISGRDFLRIQHYSLPHPATGPAVAGQFAPLHFENGLVLDGVNHSLRAQAGEIFYVQFRWSLDSEAMRSQTGSLQGDVSVGLSLRLLHPGLMHPSSSTEPQATELWAVQDTRLSVPIPDPAPGEDITAPDSIESQTNSLGLPIPLSIPPGAYALELIVYDLDTLTPLSPVGSEPPGQGSAIRLENLAVELPARELLPMPAIGRFDYIQLLSAQWWPEIDRQAQSWELNLVWQPRTSAYRDTYEVIVEWVDSAGNPVAAWQSGLGPPHHPSGDWQTHVPVRRIHRFDLSQSPTPIEPGRYTVRLGLRRTADGAEIQAARPLGLGSTRWIELGQLHVVAD